MILSHHRPVPALFVSPDAVRALREDAARLPVWTLDRRQEGDLMLLMAGGCAPLRGYMTQAQHDAVLAGAVLPWPVPLALAVDDEFGGRASPGGDIALGDRTGTALAIMSVTDRWGQGAVLLGGRVKGLHRSGHPTPNEIRGLWRGRNAARVLAIQPRHGDEIAQAVDRAVAVAVRMEAALLIQLLPGMRADAPPDAVVAALPAVAPDGPRRLPWQCAVARNFGATHLLADDGPVRDLTQPDHGATASWQPAMPDHSE